MTVLVLGALAGLAVLALLTFHLVRKLLPHSSENWDAIKREVIKREDTLHEIKAHLAGKNVGSAIELASVDMFVEKAQKHLAERSTTMAALSLLSSLLLLASVGVALATLLGFLLESAFAEDASTLEATILSILHNLAVLGVFLGLVYLFASLLRAFLHETTVLNNRIHALRLGRLYIYMQFASAEPDERKAIRERLAATDMDRIFGWNYESSTAFKDIRPEFMTRNLAGSLLDALGKLAGRKGT